jgi:hypothetical protein
MLQAQSVNQLLQVLESTRRKHGHGNSLPAAYQEAIHDVSSRHHVRYQTIGDLCRRRLALSDIAEFVNLLDRWLRGDPGPLKSRILQHSVSAARSSIEHFFDEGQPASPFRSGTPLFRATVSDARSAAPPVERAVDAPDEEIRLRIPATLSRRIHLAQLAKIGATREEAAIALIDRGFEAEKDKIRELLESL